MPMSVINGPSTFHGPGSFTKDIGTSSGGWVVFMNVSSKCEPRTVRERQDSHDGCDSRILEHNGIK
jgi:hypothetical protein